MRKTRKEVKSARLKEIVEMTIQEMRKNLDISEQNEYLEIQHIVGMKCVFRGQVVKSWSNASKVQTIEIKHVDKIIIKQSVLFYSKV